MLTEVNSSAVSFPRNRESLLAGLAVGLGDRAGRCPALRRVASRLSGKRRFPEFSNQVQHLFRVEE